MLDNKTEHKTCANKGDIIQKCMQLDAMCGKKEDFHLLGSTHVYIRTYIESSRLVKKIGSSEMGLFEGFPSLKF